MKDWVDRNFKKLARARLMERIGPDHYRLTEKGSQTPVGILQNAKYLDFHQLHLEDDAGKWGAAHARLIAAAKKWQEDRKALAGTPDHILVSFLEDALEARSREVAGANAGGGSN